MATWVTGGLPLLSPLSRLVGVVSATSSTHIPPIFDYPGVACFQDGDGRLRPLWASKILFRNLRVTSRTLRPFFLQSMVCIHGMNVNSDREHTFINRSTQRWKAAIVMHWRRFVTFFILIIYFWPDVTGLYLRFKCNVKVKRLLRLFISQFWLLFLRLWVYMTQLRLYFSEFQFISCNSDFITRNFAFISELWDKITLQ